MNQKTVKMIRRAALRNGGDVAFMKSQWKRLPRTAKADSRKFLSTFIKPGM